MKSSSIKTVSDGQSGSCSRSNVKNTHLGLVFLVVGFVTSHKAVPAASCATRRRHLSSRTPDRPVLGRFPLRSSSQRSLRCLGHRRGGAPRSGEGFPASLPRHAPSVSATTAQHSLLPHLQKTVNDLSTNIVLVRREEYRLKEFQGAPGDVVLGMYIISFDGCETGCRLRIL